MTARPATSDDDPAPWLELLPDGVGDEQYRADVRAEARARTRRQIVDGRIAKVNAVLAEALADPAVDPLTVIGPAGELMELTALAAALPPVVPVAAERHANVLRVLPKPPFPNMPHPPMFAVAVTHHMRAHNDQIPPAPTAADTTAIEAYELVAAKHAAMFRSLDILDEPFRAGHSMADFVNSWHSVVHDDGWAALANEVAELSASIADLDALRPETHVCKVGPLTNWRLQPPTRGEPWTFANAVRAGILVRPQPKVMA